MTFSRAWTKNRKLFYCSLTLTKYFTVPSKLLVKLRDLGFSRSSHTWICSYLCGRPQCVFSKSTSYSYWETNLGVPQGSVLGRLLFCLYVNDLQGILGDGLMLRLLYADDFQVYVTCDNPIRVIHWKQKMKVLPSSLKRHARLLIGLVVTPSLLILIRPGQ